MSPYSMLLFANQAIQAGQENFLEVAQKKCEEAGLQNGGGNGKLNKSSHNSQANSTGAVSKHANRTSHGPRLDRPDLAGWCPAWATHRNQKLNLKVQNPNQHYRQFACHQSAYHVTCPSQLMAAAGLAAADTQLTAAQLTANLLATPRAIPGNGKPSVPVAAASAPSFFSMGPEEEVFDLELEELTNKMKKTVLLTPKHRTPGPVRRPSSEKIPKAPIRRNSKSVKQVRKRSFQCEEVMEYAVDTYIWKLNLQKKYQITADLEARKCEITGEMRQTLLQWMANVARHLTFSLETWCLSVNYVDRFLAVQDTDKDCLQLVGLTALLIAAKIEEQNPPEILELVELCSSAYTRKNFKHMEIIMLTRLDYNLLAPTVSFLVYHKVQIMGGKADWPTDLSRHMVEVILTDPEFRYHSPADIAAAIYKVIKDADSMMLRKVKIRCPICSPALDEYDICTREFVHCCLNDIMIELLTKDAREE